MGLGNEDASQKGSRGLNGTQSERTNENLLSSMKKNISGTGKQLTQNKALYKNKMWHLYQKVFCLAKFKNFFKLGE